MTTLSPFVAWVARVSRPARRRITPRRFKEQYINEALSRYEAPTYLEIGVRQGESFRIARAARKIGIDPVRFEEMSALRPDEEFFGMTSDQFFAEHAPGVLRPRSLHVALIDGLHEFRQAARDLFHLEPYMRPDGIVFLDDFNPRTPDRASDTPTSGAWNGDVWKLAALLSSLRRDLRYWTVDADEGVGVVAGFHSGWVGDVTDALDELKHLDFAYLEANRLHLLRLVPPSAFGQVLAAVHGE